MIHSYSETYDLNTAIGELSMLGLHTPQAISVKKKFKGLFENYSKFRILGCNFQMVCASTQSISPELLGVQAGDIDPRDVLNPILFKACTGDHINLLCDQIYNQSLYINNTNQLGSVGQVADDRPQALNCYYEMLGDDSWRKEHPQAGITVTGLKPMVHKIVSTQPFQWSGFENGHSNPQIGYVSGSGDTANGFGGPSGSQDSVSTPVNPSVFLSNGMTDMPWLPTTISRLANYINDEGEEEARTSYVTISDIPRVFMGCLVLPPAITQRLFYRMRINWFLEFKDFRPADEVGPLDPAYATGSQGHDPDGLGLSNIGTQKYATYFNIYHNATPSALTLQHSSFDATGLSEVSMVNDQVR